MLSAAPLLGWQLLRLLLCCCCLSQHPLRPCCGWYQVLQRCCLRLLNLTCLWQGPGRPVLSAAACPPARLQEQQHNIINGHTQNNLITHNKQSKSQPAS